jgi:glycosyltransferase involved in cell wall biosynthesis
MVRKKSVVPFFSIITCTKNSQKFIRTCLASVEAQTWQDFEHIIVDGESSDKTLSYITKYRRSQVGRQVTVISAIPHGIAHAMNAGIRRARGKYIYFLNSDDSFYSPLSLQKVQTFLQEHPELDWVFGQIHETTGSKTIGFPPRLPLFKGRHPGLLKFYNYIPHQATFVKKAVFTQFGHFDETLSSMMDPDLWLRIAPHTNWGYMPHVVANYLVRPDSQTENPQHHEGNTREYERVQSRYLSGFELVLAKCLNLLLR